MWVTGHRRVQMESIQFHKNIYRNSNAQGQDLDKISLLCSFASSFCVFLPFQSRWRIKEQVGALRQSSIIFILTKETRKTTQVEREQLAILIINSKLPIILNCALLATLCACMFKVNTRIEFSFLPFWQGMVGGGWLELGSCLPEQNGF